MLTASCQPYFYNEKYYEPGYLIEAGAFFGGMNCLTDLGGKNGKAKPYFRNLNLKATRPAAGIFLAAIYHHKIGFRIQASMGTVKAYDSIAGKTGEAKGRYDRNLHFQSRIKELSMLLEWYPASVFLDTEHPGRIQPYLLAGVAGFHFNPKANSGFDWVELQPLHTEGRGLGNNRVLTGKNYPLYQVNVPIGGGIRIEVGSHFHIRLESVLRILFTDYLDDVSSTYIDPTLFTQYLPPAKAQLAIQLADRRRITQDRIVAGQKRGNPANNDCYMDLHISLSYLMNRKKR